MTQLENMYRVHYHRTVEQMLLTTRDYLDSLTWLTPFQTEHILAGLTLHMEAQNYRVRKKVKDYCVGNNYDWSKNIM